MGLYNNNKELMTEDDFERLHLRLGKKAMEKLMKPAEATWEGRGVRRGGGYLEPLVLLEPPAHNPGCSCVRLDRQLRNVCLIFRVLRLVAEALALHPFLDAPAPCACLLNSVLLTVLDLCLFMPDPRLLDPVSLFLTDERSDAAVVGSGNKAMGTSPFLTF